MNYKPNITESSIKFIKACFNSPFMNVNIMSTGTNIVKTIK